MHVAATRKRAPVQPALLLVDDHHLIRVGLRALLRAHSRPAHQAPTIFEAASLSDALVVYASNETAIRLVLLDLALGDAVSLQGLSTFRRRFPSACIAVLSGSASDDEATEALAMGATAFLRKAADLGNVISFVRAAGLLPAAPADAPDAVPPTQLTKRQSDVLAWLLAGKTNKEIAALEHLGEGTVKNHVSAVLLAHGVRSRAQLISRFR